MAGQSRAGVRWKVPYFAPWPLSFRSVLETAGPDGLEGTMMAQTVIQDAANSADPRSCSATSGTPNSAASALCWLRRRPMTQCC